MDFGFKNLNMIISDVLVAIKILIFDEQKII